MLLDQLQTDPENFDLLWLVAAEASGTGRYDEAIQALERLLIYFPQDPDVRIELGVMYFRLGAFEHAQRQFEIAQNLDDPLTEEQIARIASFDLALSMGLEGFEQSIVLTPTLSYTDNPLSRSDQDRVYLFGVLVDRPEYRRSGRASVRLDYAITFEPDSAIGETYNFFASAQYGYSNFDDNNVWIIGADEGSEVHDYALDFEIEGLLPFGMSFNGLVARGSIGARLDRILTDITESYRRTFNVYAGLQQSTSDTTLDLGLRYFTSESRTKDRTGMIPDPYGVPARRVYSAEFKLVHRVNESIAVDVGGYAALQTGLRAPDTDLSGLNYGLTISGRSASGLQRSTRAEYSLINSKAHEGDPFILATEALSTQQAKLSVTQDYQINDSMNVILSVSQSSQRSNLPNGEISNWSASIAVPYRF